MSPRILSAAATAAGEGARRGAAALRARPARLLGACRHGQRREHDDGDRAIGGSDEGGHEKLLKAAV